MKATIAMCAMSVALTGCLGMELGNPEPFEFSLSTDWSNPEDEVLREAAEIWERMTCLDLFNDQGYEPHDGGWTRPKLNDHKDVVYPFSQIDTTPDIEDYLEMTGGFAGYFCGDILIMRGAYLRSVDDQICFYSREGDPSRCLSEEEAREDFVFQFNLELVKRTAIHEFGHALGLDHNDSAPSVMGTDASPPEFYSVEPTAADIDNLCRLYDCPADCPTRP
ncbi:MAG: matrixin family metalloprotease [Patescibacteria group bacterium]